MEDEFCIKISGNGTLDDIIESLNEIIKSLDDFDSDSNGRDI